MIYALTDDIHFPDPTKIHSWYGEIAIGGDLSEARLTEAYSRGIFPLSAYKKEALRWCCPMNRFVIFPEEIHVSHSMRNLFNKGQYRVTFNEAFEQVIGNCRGLRASDPNAWISPDIVKAYTDLFRAGKAGSVEVWEGDRLVGGLYGVTLGKHFFGESMFSLVPSGSKIALIALARRMQGTDGIIDCQYETRHLKSMGGRHITYNEYMEFIKDTRG